MGEATVGGCARLAQTYTELLADSRWSPGRAHIEALRNQVKWSGEAMDDLSVSLKHAINIIEKHVPRDALGVNAQGDPDVPGGYQVWPLLDEYLHNMKAALAKASTPPVAATDNEGGEQR